MKASTCLIILACVVLMIVVIWAAESESATASASKTRTRSRTATRSKSPATKSRTRTRSRTRSVGSKSKTRSRSRSRTKVTPSRSKTRSRTASRTKTAAVTKTKSLTRTRSKSLSKAITKSKSLSRTRSRSLSKAITKSRSISLSRSRSLSKSKSLSQAATKSQTPSQAVTKTRTASLTKSISLSQAVTMSSSVSRSRTRTVSRSLSRSISRSSTGSPAAPSQSKTISFSPQRSLTRTRSSSKSKAVDVTPSRTASRTRTRSVSKSPSLSLAPSRTCPSGFYNPSTATGPSGDTSYFQEAYGIWKTRYVVSADPAPGLKVIDPTDCANPGRSLAQGIAYGMILSAYAVDGATFDGLLEYFEYYRTTEGCLPSVVLADGVIPPWGADCDTASAQDIAFALFVAAETWNNDAYFETATKIVTHLYDTSVDPTTQLVLPFPTPAGTSPGDILIPSYFSPAYYKLFEERDPNAAHDWEGVRQATQTLTTLIQTKQTTKLLPDFANKNGDPVSLTLGFNYRRALSGTYTSGQQTTNSVAAPAANRVALWPFRFQFDPTSNPSKLVFKITNVNVSSSVTLGGNPVTVWVKCGSSYGQATLTSIQQLTNVWVYTPSGQCTFPNGDGIDLIQPVDIRVYTDKSNTFYDFHNIESANTQCQFNRDQYDNLYSYEAVRAWFYLALDAAFYGNYPATNPSVTICSTLAATVFSTTAALDGEKYLDSNPVYNGDYGFEFIAPASLCWIVSTASGRQTVFNYLRKDGDANLLNDNQYLADTLHTLAFLFVGDEFRVPTCNAFGSTRSLPGGFDPTFEPSLGYTTDAPVIDDTAAFCLRPSTDVNVGFVSAWSVAVEFQDPNVQYYDVSIDCSGQGFVQAQAPIPDLLNTRYINTSCPESDVTIRLTPKAGYTGSEYELSGDLSSSGSLCETAPPRLQFCWKYPRSQYYLPITAGYTLTSLEAYCFSPDGLFSLDPANGGVYPYMFDKAPTSACSLTGEVALLVNGNSVVSTNLYNEDQCPFYCFVWNSGTIENGYKITVTFQDAVSAVSMDCYNGAGYQTASFEYNYAYSIPVGNCAVNGSIRLKYTHSGSANTVETNYITSACYSAEALPPGVPPPPSAPTPPPNTLGWLPFCLGPASTKNYIDVRTFVNSPAMVSGVKVYCAEGWHNATLTQDPGVPERFAGSITTCPTTAIVVELTYNTASGYMAANYPDAPTLFNADVTQTLCPKICYQAPVDTFYVGMGLSYNATNATISCNGQYVASMCLDTNLNPRYCGYFAGTDHNILSAVGDLYDAILDTVSECTTITAYFDKNAAGNSGLTTSGFEVIQGQWYTEINPFTPLPPSDPHRCKK